jgi:hypothetical protein
VTDLEKRIHELDRVTVAINICAEEFGVTWSASANRAVSLNLCTRKDIDDILELALQEKVENQLKDYHG